MRDFASLALSMYFAAVLGISALAKLDNRLSFEVALNRYQVLPGWAPRPISLVFPWLELTVAVGLAFAAAPVVFAVLAAAMFLGFLGIEAVVFMSGRQVRCGCYGALTGRRIDSASVVTSLLLAALAAANLWLSLRAGSGEESIRPAAAGLFTAALLFIAGRVATRKLHANISSSAARLT